MMNPDREDPLEKAKGQDAVALSNVNIKGLNDKKIPRSTYEEGVSPKQDAMQGNAKRLKTVKGHHNEQDNHNSSDEDQYYDAEGASNEQPDSRYNQLKREKRLAMNRASAKERRRRKKELVKHLEEKVLQLSKQLNDAQEANNILKIYTKKLEADLSQAHGTIRLLSVGNAPRGAGQPLQLPPLPNQHLAGVDTAPGAPTIQEVERIRTMLGASNGGTAIAPGIPGIHASVLPPALSGAGEAGLRLNAMPAAGADAVAAMRAGLPGGALDGIRSPNSNTRDDMIALARLTNRGGTDQGGPMGPR